VSCINTLCFITIYFYNKCSFHFLFYIRTGIVVFAITGLQIALGLLAIWALANVESAATGIVCYLKHFHFYLGGALLLTAW
jgi:hypothetical protein